MWFWKPKLIRMVVFRRNWDTGCEFPFSCPIILGYKHIYYDAAVRNDQKRVKQHHNFTVTGSPKPPFDLMGKIKLQLHTFLPMMSWKCMLTAWSTDCSASKVINPKPSQRPRVNQGSGGGGGVVTTQDEEQFLGFSRVRVCQDRARGSWGWDDVAHARNNTNQDWI